MKGNGMDQKPRSVALSLVLGAVLLNVIAGAAERPPNIVLLLADDLGWTGVGCYGSDLHETPHIDRLAAQGMRFTYAYAACTVCSPTRASIMTGQYPARLHLTDFIAGQHRPFEKLTIPAWTKYLRPEAVTVAEALKRAGYATAHVGKWHLEARQAVPGHRSEDFQPTAQGFDVSIGKPKGSKGYFLPPDYVRASGEKGGYVTDFLTDEAVAQIRRMQQGPFFLYLAYHTPHTPIQGKKELVAHYTRKLQTRPNAGHRNPIYAAMIHSLDESVGRIMAQLQNSGLKQDTLVIFVSDNGGLTQRYGKIDGIADNYPLRRGKGSAYEGGVRVPMIAHWPGAIPAGRICAEPVMTIDFYPTFMDLAAAPASASEFDGVSLKGLLKGKQSALGRAALYWHYPHYHAGGDAPYSAIRSGPWRLISFHDDTPPALYNLDRDIGEQHNLAQAEPATFQELQERLQAWRKRVGAQMPTENDRYDPARAGKPAKRGR